MTTNFEDVKIAPLSMIIKNIPYTIVNQRERERLKLEVQQNT